MIKAANTKDFSDQENHPNERGGLPLGSAESQNRTGDTLIFSQVLYQLSYLGTLQRIVLVASDDVKKVGASARIPSGCLDQDYGESVLYKIRRIWTKSQLL
jgi:hypothetical protein